MSFSGAFQQQVLDIQSSIFCLGNQVRQQSISVAEIGDYIPGSVMVQDLNAMTNLYMNKFGCDILHHSSEELKTFGAEYFSRFFPADEIVTHKQALMQFINQNDSTRLHSFLQRVRPGLHAEFSWYFTTSRLITSPTDPAFSNLVNIAVPVNMLSMTGHRISNMIENDDYIRKNFYRFNMLSTREKEIIRLIVEGRSSYEIAQMLFRSIHTINTHRKNIIHKLEVNSLASLIKFAVAFNLV
jgi:DNA-binding CsgD family transcriptional regulator